MLSDIRGTDGFSNTENNKSIYSSHMKMSSTLFNLDFKTSPQSSGESAHPEGAQRDLWPQKKEEFSITFESHDSYGLNIVFVISTRHVLFQLSSESSCFIPYLVSNLTV